jgi:hypothetical protein
MSGIVRAGAISLVVVGLFSTFHSRVAPPTDSTSVSLASIPVPVCPPNDPNGCHIDQW